MRDEFYARFWNAGHDAVGTALTQISEDCARGINRPRDAFAQRIRTLGFRSAAMIAALVVSGSTILATVTPIAGA